MKKIIATTALAMAMAFGTATGNTQMMAGQQMMDKQGQQQNMMAGHMSPCMRMYGMGMMGSGMGMMGRGMIMGSGMMGGGMGMMGPGMMMGSGMMGSGMGIRNMQQYDKFMNYTKELRLKLHDMRFEYIEAMRNPKTTIGDLRHMMEKMAKLRQEIMQKMPKMQDKGH